MGTRESGGVQKPPHRVPGRDRKPTRRNRHSRMCSTKQECRLAAEHLFIFTLIVSFLLFCFLFTSGWRRKWNVQTFHVYGATDCIEVKRFVSPCLFIQWVQARNANLRREKQAYHASFSCRERVEKKCWDWFLGNIFYLHSFSNMKSLGFYFSFLERTSERLEK